MANQRRAVPDGYVKTSFEIAQTSKWLLEDISTDLRRRGIEAGIPEASISEAAVIEALILAAEAQGVNTAILTKVIRTRKKAQEAQRQTLSAPGTRKTTPRPTRRKTAK